MHNLNITPTLTCCWASIWSVSWDDSCREAAGVISSASELPSEVNVQPCTVVSLCWACWWYHHRRQRCCWVPLPCPVVCLSFQFSTYDL